MESLFWLKPDPHFVPSADRSAPYPLDFTFVCPTEITAFSDRVAEFNKLNTQVHGTVAGEGGGGGANFVCEPKNPNRGIKSILLSSSMQQFRSSGFRNGIQPVFNLHKKPAVGSFTQRRGNGWQPPPPPAGSQVLGVSVDSQFSHLAWVQTPRKEGGLGDINYPLAQGEPFALPTRLVSQGGQPSTFSFFCTKRSVNPGFLMVFFGLGVGGGGHQRKIQFFWGGFSSP